jgi:hypothetical protein
MGSHDHAMYIFGRASPLQAAAGQRAWDMGILEHFSNVSVLCRLNNDYNTPELVEWYKAGMNF